MLPIDSLLYNYFHSKENLLQHKTFCRHLQTLCFLYHILLQNFERFFRAHQNTTEQLVVFLPAIFACAYFVSETLAAAMGLIFVVGRMMYFRGYTDPEKSRSLGFGLGLIANTILILASLYQIGIAAVG